MSPAFTPVLPDASRRLSRHPKNGFTLVELLVVIGIIALLISVLMPALTAARQQAQKTQCLSNLRSLGQAVALYQAEHKGVYPPLSSYATTAFSGNRFRGPNLWVLLKVEAGSTIATCPKALTELEWPTWSAANAPNRALYSYRYNWFVAGAETNTNVAPHLPHAKIDTGTGALWPTPMRTVPNSSETLLMIDYPQLVAFQTNGDAGSDRGMDTASVKPSSPSTATVNGVVRQPIRSIAPSHGTPRRSPYGAALSDGSVPVLGMTNVLYCDGSARSVEVAQAQITLTADPGRREVLNDSTANGNIKAGNLCVVEGTRLDPTLQP
jgi:prepilin-type N-terminal cleavage/methylation domain-containing protein/prepilin-type processing-associated H-X9-DG protein